MKEINDSQLVIQKPPKIYLDTNHLVNISRVRKGIKLPAGQSQEDYKRLDEYIKSCCGLIFNPLAALEWVEGNATLDTACEIAAVVDSAKLKYRLEIDSLIFTYEVLNQCYKQNNEITIPNLPPVLQNISDNSIFISSLGILATQVPDYLDENQKRFQENGHIPIEVPILTVLEWIMETLRWKKNNPETYQERINGFKVSLSEDIEHKNEYFSDRLRYQRNWIKRFLKIDKILKIFNPDINVDKILENIDIKYCPAVNLYWTLREKRMRSGNPPKDNDVDDYMFIPVVPYADIILTDNNLREFILQADRNLKLKVFSKVSKALNVLDSQKFTW